jgi:2-dehydro-3-deoxyphosphogluconate aldolase/(4S)-4-hydroxy-2-oxoglutarate aldolase
MTLPMTSEAKKWIEDLGLVPVLRAPSRQIAMALVEAMVAGGVTVIEVTMTVPGAIGVLEDLKTLYGDRLLLGSGSVTHADEAEATIKAGADFVISPSLHLDVIARTRALGKLSIPGALTPTEVITAWKAGADFVKVFPCSAMGGAKYLKSLKAPFPHVRLIPTGGVTLQTAAEFLHAGAEALGVGADLVNPASITSGRPETVTQTARAYLEAIAQARGLTTA